jgi:hypothetical protein
MGSILKLAVGLQLSMLCLAGQMGIVDGCAGFVLKPMGSSGNASTVVMAVPVRKVLRLFWMMTVMRRQLLSHGFIVRDMFCVASERR